MAEACATPEYVWVAVGLFVASACMAVAAGISAAISARERQDAMWLRDEAARIAHAVRDEWEAQRSVVFGPRVPAKRVGDPSGH